MDGFLGGRYSLCIIAAAGTCATAWTVWQWIGRPYILVRRCKKQGIVEYFSSSKPGQVKLTNEALLRTWNGLISIKDFDKVFILRMGKSVRLVITDPALLRQVLVDNSDSYSKPSYIHALNILGKGLFTSHGDVWADQRRLLGPAFHNKEIKKKIEDIRDSVLSRTKRMDCATNNEVKGWTGGDQEDVYLFFLELMLEISGKTIFGTDLTNDAVTIYRSFNRYLNNKWNLSFGSPSRSPGYKFLWARLHKEILEDEDQLKGILMDIIRRRKLEHNFGANTAGLLFDRLLEASEAQKNEALLLDNGMTFLLTGHETTASLLTWTFYLLSQHPEWQTRARNEVLEFHADWSDLAQLKVINMILLESLRLFPPQPLIGRSCIRDNTVGNLIIPKDVEVLIPIAAIHYSSALWGPDSSDFRPDRFSHGISGACEHLFGYMPFGFGPRTCIGQSLAMTEAKIILAMMLKTYMWELPSTYVHSPVFALALLPEFGMPIRITKL